MPPRRIGSKRAIEVPNIVRAVEHAATAQRDIGQPYQSHVQIANGWAVAYDGVTSAGWRVGEQFTSCPHTATLKAALDRCEGEISLTETYNALVVRGKRGRFVVPCVGFDLMPNIGPDANIAPVGKEVLDALAVCAELTTDKAQRFIESCILLQGGTCVGTNSKIMIEYWHGFDLPPSLVVPKSFVTALVKTAREPTGFGYTPGHTITFWFGPDAWLKTQLYEGEYPQYQRLFADFDACEFLPFDAQTTTAALAAIKPFLPGACVCFSAAHMRSHPVSAGDVGATFELSHPFLNNVGMLADGLAFMLAHTKEWAQTRDVFFFRGERARGIVMGQRINASDAV